MEKSTIGSPKAMMNWKGLVTRPQTLINSPIVDVEPGHKRNQAENMNKEATSVKGEKKHRIVENEQGFVCFSYCYLDFEVFLFLFFLCSLQCNRASLAYASDAKEKNGVICPYFSFPLYI